MIYPNIQVAYGKFSMNHEHFWRCAFYAKGYAILLLRPGNNKFLDLSYDMTNGVHLILPHEFKLQRNLRQRKIRI